MMFRFALKSIRESCGCSLEDIASYLSIPIESLGEIELDPGLASSETIQNIADLYGISIDFIFPGTEKECVEHNQLLLKRKIQTPA